MSKGKKMEEEYTLSCTAPTIITTIQSFNSHFEYSNLCFFLLQIYIFVSQILGNRANTNDLPFQKLI